MRVKLPFKGQCALIVTEGVTTLELEKTIKLDNELLRRIAAQSKHHVGVRMALQTVLRENCPKKYVLSANLMERDKKTKAAGLLVLRTYHVYIPTLAQAKAMSSMAQVLVNVLSTTVEQLKTNRLKVVNGRLAST
jgi:hypothetical protein